MNISLARPATLIRQTLIYTILIVGAVVMIFPLLWTVSTSLKTLENVSFAAQEIQLIPDPVAWENYVELFRKYTLVAFTINTLKVVIPGLFGAWITCSLAGYAFARIDFPGREIFFLIVLSTMMLPGVVRLIPLYVMFDQVHMINTFWPLIIPRILGHDAFYIFLYRQFFRGIPQDFFDAARVDGATELGIWWRIVLPLSKPVLATVGIFSFQYTWNDFLYPLIYIGARRANWTLILGLNSLRTAEGQLLWHIIMAFSVVVIIPMLVAFALGQRLIVQGASLSGIKG
jgi:ABC-type glycerol-3-phosphate transport system permease component